MNSTSEILQALKDLERNPFRQSNSHVVVQRAVKQQPEKLRKDKNAFPMSSLETSKTTNKTVELDTFTNKQDNTKSFNPDTLLSTIKQQKSIPRTLGDGSLKKSLRTAIIENKNHECSILKTFEDTVSLVPAHYFIKHKQFDAIKSIALQSVFKILDKMRLRFLKQAMQIWSTKSAALSLIRQLKSVCILQRVIRGFIGRRKAKSRRKAMLDMIRASDRLKSVTRMNRNERATIIQTFIRRVQAQEKYKILLKRHRAALEIQHCYLSYKHRGRTFYLVHTVLRYGKIAITIQRYFRGFLGRMKTRVRRTEVHRQKVQERYETPSGVFEFYFEQHGAAIRLQRWYKNLEWIVKLRQMRRDIIHKDICNKKAIIIQKIVRGGMARKRTRALIQKKRLEERYSLANITKIQALARGYMSRCKNIDIVSRIRRNREKRNALKGFKMARRPSIFFPNLLISDEKNIRKMESKAFVIQNIYRKFKARCRFLTMIKDRDNIAARKIQRWLRLHQKRRKVIAALRVIQPAWRRAVAIRFQRKFAVLLVSVWID